MGFKNKEDELRQQDNELQKQLITYASFLDSNMKTMKNCRAAIDKLKIENKNKDEEIVKKKQYMQILQEKRERIESEKKAVLKYQDFLETVREEFNDEYNEVVDILNRYYTLQESNQQLSQKLFQM